MIIPVVDEAIRICILSIEIAYNNAIETDAE